MGVRLEVIGVKLIVFIAQERLNFVASGKVGGEVCVVIFGSGLGFCEAVSVALREFKF
ncbi:hypothetical protein [Campylobacter sp.]|uniref:hypothetical protein n=1 Tax=Campylobacter sp. TaxID=205 RepID=UPI0027B92738|nr:hypothetical protein [Campylobacter sp.]